MSFKLASSACIYVSLSNESEQYSVPHQNFGFKYRDSYVKSYECTQIPSVLIYLSLNKYTVIIMINSMDEAPEIRLVSLNLVDDHPAV